MNKKEAAPVIEQVVEIVTGMRRPDWERIKHGVDVAFSEQTNKVRVDDPRRLKQLIDSQFTDY